MLVLEGRTFVEAHAKVFAASNAGERTVGLDVTGDGFLGMRNHISQVGTSIPSKYLNGRTIKRSNELRDRDKDELRNRKLINKYN